MGYIVLKAINAVEQKPTWDYVSSKLGIPLGKMTTMAMDEFVARFFAEGEQHSVHSVAQCNQSQKATTTKGSAS